MRKLKAKARAWVPALVCSQLTANTNRDGPHSQEEAGGTLRGSVTTWLVTTTELHCRPWENSFRERRKRGRSPGRKVPEERCSPLRTQYSEKLVPQESTLYLKLCLASLKQT